MVSPGFSPSIAAIRSAAARAATRRGESSRISPLHQSSPSSAGATAVVLPAPGGATSTALGPSRSAAFNCGNTAWMGRRESSDIAPPLTQSVTPAKASFADHSASQPNTSSTPTPNRRAMRKAVSRLGE